MTRPEQYADIWSRDRAAQHAAFTRIFAMTDEPVDWSYEVWDDVVAHLTSKDNHDRSISAQLLARLAKSDPEGRIRADFPKIMSVTRDERFVTARHALKASWRVGLAGDWQRAMVVDGLTKRFGECEAEKNCTLIRFDIVVTLKRLADESGDDSVFVRARELAESEPDPKYRKKNLSALK
jgi:hypothetical protein